MIKQMKNGWRADFWLGTHRVRKTFPMKKLAEVFEVTKKNEYLHGKFVPNSKRDNTTFKALVEKFYSLHAQVNMTQPGRSEIYRLKELKSCFGDRRLSEINQKDIEELKAHLIQKDKPSTVNRKLTTLKSLLNKAVHWGHLKESPAERVNKLREDNTRLRFLTENEVSKLLEAASPSLKTFILIGLNTGLRRSNIINLKWEDIDGRNGVIHVLKTKSGKSYGIPINDAMKNLLRDLSQHGTQGRIFEVTNLQKEWQKAVKKAGLKDCPIHVLRHTYASHLVMKGANLFTVSQFLGHSNTKMTARYSHLSPKFQRIEANLINFGTKLEITQKDLKKVELINK